MLECFEFVGISPWDFRSGQPLVKIPQIKRLDQILVQVMRIGKMKEAIISRRIDAALHSVKVFLDVHH